MRVKKESEKPGLKLNIRKMKILRAGPITSWITDGGKKWKQWHFSFLGSKITEDGYCSHEIRRQLLLGRKAMTNLDSMLKRKKYFADKGPYSQSLFFPVVVYGYNSWTIKKAEHRTDPFELWCWRRPLRGPWKAKKSTLNTHWKD